MRLLGRLPINVPCLDQLLQNYPNVDNAKCLSNGVMFGFDFLKKTMKIENEQNTITRFLLIDLLMKSNTRLTKKFS